MNVLNSTQNDTPITLWRTCQKLLWCFGFRLDKCRLVYLTISTLLNNIVELSCCFDSNASSWVKRMLIVLLVLLLNIYGTLFLGIGIGKGSILSDPDTEFHAHLIKIQQARKREKPKLKSIRQHFVYDSHNHNIRHNCQSYI